MMLSTVPMTSAEPWPTVSVGRGWTHSHQRMWSLLKVCGRIL